MAGLYAVFVFYSGSTSLGTTPTVSFCTTCKGRLHHLSETLPHNLRMTKDIPGIEFVVLDYDSQDGLADWMRTHMQTPMQEGRVRYAKHAPAPYFKMAHAKNMAHRLGTGDVLCNLDADNRMVAGFPAWLQERFSDRPDSIVSGWSAQPVRQIGAELRMRYLERGKSRNGGLIAVSAPMFHRLGGYDEQRFEGWGPDDIDFSVRGQLSGLARVEVPYALRMDAIRHSNEERVEHLRPEVAEVSLARANLSPLAKLGHVVRETGERRSDLRANPQGYGEGRLIDIDGHPIDTLTSGAAELQESRQPGQTNARSTDWGAKVLKPHVVERGL